MGGGSWSRADYAARSARVTKSGKSAFAYSDAVHATGDLKVHPDLDPKKLNSLGFRVRESLDSETHPESVAVAVFLDVTGSMRTVPVVAQKKLGQLMNVILGKNYLQHPQILFGAIGDAKSDEVPLQVGQFESGLEMDDQLSKIVLEGNGGSQIHESYELACYFMARYSVLDCFRKRGKKGYLFLVGDEKFYSSVSKSEVLEVIGDEIQSDIPTREIIKELQEKYEVFCIIPLQTTNGRNPEIQKLWKSVLEERVLLLEDSVAISETIAMAIGWNEGAVSDVNDAAIDLISAGADKDSVHMASKAITAYTNKCKAVARASAVSNLPACSSKEDFGRV